MAWVVLSVAAAVCTLALESSAALRERVGTATEAAGVELACEESEEEAISES